MSETPAVPPVSERGREVDPAVRTAIEVAIRLGAVALMLAACLLIVAPFLGIVLWAVIIALGLEGPHEQLARGLGGRRRLAAVAIVGGILLALIVPAAMLSETLVSGAQDFAQRVRAGEPLVPPPDARVAAWPLVGTRVFEIWTLASENLAEALRGVAPQLRAVSAWLLRAAGSAGAGLLQLVVSILIAGVMLTHSERRRAAIARFAVRMAGREQGPRLAHLAQVTVRGVVQGILGIAFIQAVLAGIGFAVAGAPGAGLWALGVLVAAVVQLPVLLVMLPPMIWGFSSLGLGAAIALAVWCFAITLLDNVLKPLFFGRGVEVPSLVIFAGAIGGMLTMGIVGLFLGAAVLALGYALFTAWLAGPEEVAPAS